MLSIHDQLSDGIYKFQKKYLRKTVLISLSYDDNADAAHIHPMKASLKVLLNPLNYLTVRFSKLKSKNILLKIFFELPTSNFNKFLPNDHIAIYKSFQDKLFCKINFFTKKPKNLSKKIF